MTKNDADYSNIRRVAKGKMKAKQTEHNSNQKLQISKDSSASFLQNNNKKKKVDKKKARRYAEQDEDDRELAMLALGHGKHVVIHEKSKSKQAVRDEEIIKKKQSTSPEDLVMIIKPSEEATYKNTVDILDEMTISEIKRYAMVDISDGEYQLVKATEAANGIK
jgi:hypothetical protein